MRVRYIGPYSGNILSLRTGESEVGTVRAILIGDQGAFYFYYGEDSDDLHHVAPVGGATLIDLSIPNNWVIEPVDQYILNGIFDPNASGKLFDKDRFGNLYLFVGEKKLNREKTMIDLICGD